MLHAKKTAFVVEHDFIMATYLADRVVVYEGTPAIDCTANAYVFRVGWRGGEVERLKGVSELRGISLVIFIFVATAFGTLDAFLQRQ